MVRALASHQCGPGSNPGVDAICGVGLLVGSLPCSERFFSGYSSKINISKFQFDQESGRRRTYGYAGLCRAVYDYVWLCMAM